MDEDISGGDAHHGVGGNTAIGTAYVKILRLLLFGEFLEIIGIFADVRLRPFPVIFEELFVEDHSRGRFPRVCRSTREISALSLSVVSSTRIVRAANAVSVFACAMAIWSIESDITTWARSKFLCSRSNVLCDSRKCAGERTN